MKRIQRIKMYRSHDEYNHVTCRHVLTKTFRNQGCKWPGDKWATLGDGDMVASSLEVLQSPCVGTAEEQASPNPGLGRKGPVVRHEKWGCPGCEVAVGGPKC